MNQICTILVRVSFLVLPKLNSLFLHPETGEFWLSSDYGRGRFKSLIPTCFFRLLGIFVNYWVQAGQASVYKHVVSRMVSFTLSGKSAAWKTGGSLIVVPQKIFMLGAQRQNRLISESIKGDLLCLADKIE